MKNNPVLAIEFLPNMREGAKIMFERANTIRVKLGKSHVQLLIDGIMVKQWRDNNNTRMIIKETK